MSLIKNKSTLYAVMRRDNDFERDVLCCFTKTLEEANRLANEYEQQWYDQGGDKEMTFFYSVANIFYDA